MGHTGTTVSGDKAPAGSGFSAGPGEAAAQTHRKTGQAGDRHSHARKWDAMCASAERETKATGPVLGASSWGAANQGSKFSPAYGAGATRRTGAEARLASGHLCCPRWFPAFRCLSLGDFFSFSFKTMWHCVRFLMFAFLFLAFDIQLNISGDSCQEVNPKLFLWQQIMCQRVTFTCWILMKCQKWNAFLKNLIHERTMYPLTKQCCQQETRIVNKKWTASVL